MRVMPRDWWSMWLVHCLVTIGVLAVGCSRETEDKPTISGQDSPRAVVRKWHHAQLKGNEKQFVECILGDEAYKEFARRGFPFSQATYGYRRALIKAYGPNACEEFDKRKVESNIKLRCPPLDPEWSEKVKINVDGDVATFEMKGWYEPGRLAKKEGLWFMGPSDVARDELEDYAETMEALARAVRRATQDLGKPGIDIAEAKRRLAECIYEEMRSIRKNED